MTPEQNAKLQQWYTAKQQLTAYKDSETILRREVIEMFSQTAVDSSGTESIEIENGWKLKIQKSLDYKLINKNGEVEAALEGVDDKVAELLVKWEPKLDVKNYKALSADIQKQLESCLVIKPSSPQVDLEPPKVIK